MSQDSPGTAACASCQAHVSTPVYEWRPMPEKKDLYTDSQRELMGWYRRYLDTSAILIPSGAMACIDTLNNLSTSPLMILSADRGVSQVSQFAMQPEPRFANHGSFSLPVNYHALGLYVKQQGGLALTCQRRDTGLALCTLLLSNEPSAHAQNGTSATVDAFNKHFRDFNPDDAYSLKRALEKVGQQLTPDQMLAHLRLSRWDYRILNLFFPSLLDYCRYFDPSERLQWITALSNTWENYYPLGDKIDPSFQMGVMAMELGIWGLGKDCFKAAIHYHGKTFESLFNLALCSCELGEFEQAEKYLLQAKTIIERQTAKPKEGTEPNGTDLRENSIAFQSLI